MKRSPKSRAKCGKKKRACSKITVKKPAGNHAPRRQNGSHIRKRLVEFMGGSDDAPSATCAYLARCDGVPYARRTLHPPNDLDWFLKNHFDAARSLYDHRSLLVHLDVEYVNFDAPAQAYLDPQRSFNLQEPLVQVIEETLLEFGIAPLHLITGQGHHFVWRLLRGKKNDLSLEKLIRFPGYCESTLHEPLDVSFIPEPGPGIKAAFAGLALVMEFLAHEIKRRAAPRCQLPVEITALHVGPTTSSSQREMLSIDISEYGDPLITRMVRMPFTHYRKPWQTGLAKALGVENQLPPIRSVPLHEHDIQQTLQIREDENAINDLAKRASTRIPLEEKGMTRLIHAYRKSSLHDFHAEYYRLPLEHSPGPALPLEPLPPCAAHILTHPNELLLKPAGMQLVTRSLLATGWHPRRIASLIRGIFEDDHHQWKLQWTECDPGLRADFYTRLFSGLILTGLDQLVDFNCTSTQEKGFCFDAAHGCNLAPWKTKLQSPFPHQ